MTACDASPFACSTRTKIWFAALIAIQLALYTLLTLLSSQFHFDSFGETRPLRTVLGILAAAFVAYLGCIPLALRLADSNKWVVVFFAVAIISRGIVFFSEPIQEVDIYRYIWDGAVSSENVSPYRFSPAEVLNAGETDNRDLNRLATLASQQRGLHEVLRRVHYGELPTVYPPVSQWVFHVASKFTPQQASVSTRVRVMKLVISSFDLGVMLLLFGLLRLLSLNVGWCIAYGWSPLVIKEFTNSGHLDAIAVFLVVASIVCLTVAWKRETRKWRPMLVTASSVLLGLGVGAKLYPIVLFPLVAVFVYRAFGRLSGIMWPLIACLIAVVTLAPMAADRSEQLSSIAGGPDQLQGLKTFLGQWEMNDLLFMVVEENIRPEGSVVGQPPLWFVITPSVWRTSLTQSAAQMFGGDEDRTPFLLARLITTIAFCVIVAATCAMTWRDQTKFYEAAFLTLAWFWFLSPTQNPWYWTWALPLVPFTRNRAWLIVSGLALIYYFRFWFQYHAASTVAWGLSYRGTQIFDFIVVWIEFAPFLITLVVVGYLRRSRTARRNMVIA